MDIMRELISGLAIIATPFIAIFFGAIALYISRKISPFIKSEFLRKILYFNIRKNHG